MASNSENPIRNDDRVARERIVRLFQFVAAYHEQRYPATRQFSEHEWRLPFSEVPQHDSVFLTRLVFDDASGEEDASDTEATSASRGVLLQVQRPRRTEPPGPPTILNDWLGDDWKDCSSNPTPIERKIESDGDKTTIAEFPEDLERVSALEDYSVYWNEWASRERIAMDAGKVFEQLYRLHGTLERDGERYELLLADGLLVWDRKDGGVRHPLLLRAVRLEFSPQIPEFRIVETGASTEFYSALFRSMSDVSGEAVGRIRTEVEAIDPHPLATTETNGILQSVAMALSSRGKFIGNEPPGPERDFPLLSRAPMFILRRRTSGIARAIDRVVEDALNGGEISRALQNIVGIAPDLIPPEWVSDSNQPSLSGAGVLDENTEDSVLFTKLANAEQIQIAHRLSRESCVLVQGPPGTGKTHTIANLIGHLLAEGKSVLVTSHTTKALKVLRDKVVPKLQPLCLSVLDSLGDDANLKSSIDGIVHRLGSTDAAKLDRDIADFERRRAALIGEVRSLRAAVLDARHSEYRPIVFDGSGIAPIEAAKVVAAGEATSAWIPSPVSLESRLPLNTSEILELYETNDAVTAAEEEQLQYPLPDISTFPTPDEFSKLVSERHLIKEADLTHRLDLWDEAKRTADVDVLESVIKRVRDALDSVDHLPGWTRPILAAGFDLDDRRSWLSLVVEIESVRQMAVETRELRLTHQPRLAEAVPAHRASELYEAIAADVRSSHKPPGFLTLLAKPDWKRAIEGSSVGSGSKARLLEHFEALAALAKLGEKREALKRRWGAQVEAIGGPGADSLGADVEDGCRAYVQLLNTAANWWSINLRPIADDAAATGFQWAGARSETAAVLPELDALDRSRRLVADLMAPAFVSERNRRRWFLIDDRLQELRSVASGWSKSRHGDALRRSLETLGSEVYAEAYNLITHLSSQLRRVKSRSMLLEKLERTAPNWAAEIRGRVGIHGKRSVPGDVLAAWRWRLLEDELNRRGAVSLPDLLGRLDERSSLLRDATAELADARAWRAQIARTTLTQRQALMGFAAAKKKIGKGTGKRAATFAKMARDLMTVARAAVPVWIMPIVKVAEVFDPATTRFDVVIVDESSQCEVTGLFATYLGRQVVIVGDDEQVSPSAVGEKVVDAQNLIDTYLQGIPNKQLYDGRQSLYDIAKQSFGGALSLLEHFRCVPDIIRFSNALSYNGAIRPLREVQPADPVPAVVAHRVSSVGVAGKVNEDEALEVASLVAAAIEQREYEGKTFGIISMVGDEQAYRIETLLRMILPPTDIEQRRLLAGSSAQFQGDERNVMFLSIVDAGDGTPLRMDRETKPFQQRFNVAASRAQDQMWVVYSLDPSTELKNGDIRRRLIEHALDPSALARSESEALSRVESPFERAVVERLSAAGYTLRTQYPVGSYRIDIVVTGVEGRRLAVECDGDRYHRIEDLERDVERQMVLERIGWRFVRIRGSRFYRDRDAALQPVYDRLREMGIRPLEHHDSPAPTPSRDNLLERVRARAAFIKEDLRELGAGERFGKKRHRSWAAELRVVS